MGNHMPYGITQCYLPPGSSDFPAFTPAEAGTPFSDLGMQCWVDLESQLHTVNAWTKACLGGSVDQYWSAELQYRSALSK